MKIRASLSTAANKLCKFPNIKEYDGTEKASIDHGITRTTECVGVQRPATGGAETVRSQLSWMHRSRHEPWKRHMVSEVLGCLSEYWLLKEHAFALSATSKLVVTILAKIHLLPACGAPGTTFLMLALATQFKSRWDCCALGLDWFGVPWCSNVGLGNGERNWYGIHWELRGEQQCPRCGLCSA